MKRILLVLVSLVVVVVVALVVFVFTGLGGAIKAIVEGAGSKVTGTEVTLSSADVSLTSGEGTLKGLVVGNPKGFSTPSAFELGQVHLKIDTSTVTSDVVVIKEVLIEGPKVTYEVGTGGSNIGVIQENVASIGGGGGGGSKGGAKPSGGGGTKEPKAEGGKKVIIEDLVVRGGEIDVAANFLGGKKVGTALPEIHLKDIGKDTGGATAGQVAEKLIAALTRGSLDAVAGLNLDSLKKQAGGAVEGALKDILGGKKKK